LLPGLPFQNKVCNQGGRHQKYTYELRGREQLPKNETATYITSEELQIKAEHSVADQVEAENLASKRPFSKEPEEKQKEEKARAGLVELLGVKGYVERHADFTMSVFTGEGDRPRERRLGAVITTCGEATDSTNGLTQWDGRCR